MICDCEVVPFPRTFGVNSCLIKKASRANRGVFAGLGRSWSEQITSGVIMSENDKWEIEDLMFLHVDERPTRTASSMHGLLLAEKRHC
jgi:hypothetical protein